MKEQPPVRILESDAPLDAAKFNRHCSQDGYYTNVIVIVGASARKFARQIGIVDESVARD